ncbi:hypothetical protein [Tateyamaria sp. SN6-1]|uniref:hypothetical protein n=1 Tax=Tateyamaria sp. SN6-1 TaxID=3092148 RepID=UPI0039F45644
MVLLDRKQICSVGRNQISQVDRNRSDVVLGSFALQIGKSGSRHPVTPYDAQKREGIGALGYKEARFGQLDPSEGSFDIISKGATSISAGASFRVTTAQNFEVMSNGRFRVKCEGDLSLDSTRGMSLDSQNSASIGSRTSVELSCGKASITLQKDSTVLLKGTRLLVDFSDSIYIDASSTFAVKSGRIDLNLYNGKTHRN